MDEELKEILKGKFGKTIVGIITIIVLIALTTWFLYVLAHSIAFYISEIPVFSEKMRECKESQYGYLPDTYVALCLLNTGFPLSILISIIFVVKSYRNHEINSLMLFLLGFSWFVCGVARIVSLFCGSISLIK